MDTMNLERVPSFGSSEELTCAAELLVRNCVGLPDAWAMPLVALSITWKDDRLSCCREWHADNVCHFMTGLYTSLKSSHECAVGNAPLGCIHKNMT